MNWLQQIFKKSPPLIKEKDNWYEKAILDCNSERQKFHWQELEDKNITPYVCYPFHKNGLTILVCKYDGNTEGMSLYIINKFTSEGKFKTVKTPYNAYQGGFSITKEYADNLYSKIGELNLLSKIEYTANQYQ